MGRIQVDRQPMAPVNPMLNCYLFSFSTTHPASVSSAEPFDEIMSNTEITPVSLHSRLPLALLYRHS